MVAGAGEEEEFGGCVRFVGEEVEVDADAEDADEAGEVDV